MHPPRHLIVLLLILPIAFSTGCDGGGGNDRGAGSQISDGGSSDDGGTGGDDGGSPSGFTLALTFKDKQDQPVQGMEVLLHEAGGTFRSERTDAEGAASFGDIGRPQATVTWGYELVDQSGSVEVHKRSLITAVDIPSGSHVLSCPGNRRMVPFMMGMLALPPEVEHITGVLPGITMVVARGDIKDFTLSFPPLDPQSMQQDGRISGLVLLGASSEPLACYNYFEVDPRATSQPRISLTAHSETSPLDYIIQGGSAQQVTLMLLRKGGILAPRRIGSLTSPGHTSGTLTIPSAFPFEFVGLSAVQDVDGDRLTVERFYLAAEVPETAFLTLPDFDVADIVNTISSDGRIAWIASGTTEIDMQEMTLSGGTATASTSWRWILPPNVSEVQLPELSPIYREWASAGFGDLQIQLTDCDTLDNYEEFYTDYGLELAGKCPERKTGAFQP